MALIYFQNRFVDESAAVLTAADRSFRFGDGIFETILVHNTRLIEWEKHLNRLRRGLEYFGYHIETCEMKRISAELIKRNNVREGYIRIIISRGVNGKGAIGYRPVSAEAYVVMQTVEKQLPAFAEISLYLSSIRAFYHVPCKVNSALHYTMALLEAEQKGCDNALMLSSEGYICEAATANIFWIKAGVLYTPASGLPFIPGTVKDTVCGLWEGEIRPGCHTMEDLKQADEVFITNVGSLIAGVRAILPGGVTFSQNIHTIALRKKLVSRIKEEACGGE